MSQSQQYARPPPLYGFSPTGLTGIVLFAVFSGFLAGAAIVLRFWARRLKRTSYAWNDWFAVVAWVLSTVNGAVVVEAVVNAGLGTPEAQLPDPASMIPHNLKGLIVYQIVWAGANTFVRLSMLHLYITIFRGDRFRLAAQVLMVATVLYWVAVIVLTAVFCIPFEANWNPTIPGAKCGDIHKSGISTGTFNLVLDFAVMCLPIPVLWNLQLILRKKIALVFIFGIGFLYVWRLFFVCRIPANPVASVSSPSSASSRWRS